MHLRTLDHTKVILNKKYVGGYLTILRVNLNKICNRPILQSNMGSNI